MAAGFIPGSAEICEFPVPRPRRSFAKRPEAASSTVVSFPQKPVYAVVDTCWYHADAMADEEKTRN